MGLRSLIGFSFVALALVFTGCDSDKAQKIQPETRGKRNELCQARNDCEAGLACLNGVCSKNEFGLDVTPKQCDRIECAEDTDCCGDKPMEAPAKCKAREATCSSQLPGCVNTGGICTSDASCTGGGSCPLGTCSGLGTSCETSADCKDSCDPLTLTCKYSFATCTVATQATDCSISTTCSTRFCSCANPEYDPTDPICSDPACDPSAVCLLRCQDERCVEDNSCQSSDECGAAAPFCKSGSCVQCLKTSDCDGDGEECVANVCRKPCEVNEECALFEECREGDCVYVGCKSDKDCILAANRGGGEGVGGISSGEEDPRLFKCRPSDTKEGINVCQIPCENDGTCGQFQACDKGYCKFIGCDNDEQCRAYLGIANQVPTDERPFVPTAVCRQ